MVAFLSLLCAMVALGGFVSAAALDVMTRTIPNIVVIVISLAVTGLVLLATPHAFPAHSAVALMVLAGGAALFLMRLWGAGDAKLLAAAALLCGASGLPLLIVGTALSGGVLAMALSAWRLVSRRAEDVTIPYGLAIACGAILASVSSGALGPLSR